MTTFPSVLLTVACTGALSVERRSGHTPFYTKNWVSYRVVGSRADLLAARVCENHQFPQGRKRKTFAFEGPENSYWGITKRRGDIWELDLSEPAEDKAILCELLMKGLQPPPWVLSMAWAPGAVEGPRKVPA